MLNSQARIRFICATAPALLLMCELTSAAAAEDATLGQLTIDESGAVQAIWLAQNVPFEFRGERVAYTCEAFKQKVRAVLMAVGVHSSLIVELRCGPVVPQASGRPRTGSRFSDEPESAPVVPTRLSGMSSRISTRIALAAPAIASEENIREATTFDAQERLLAKTRGEELPTASTIPVFPAVWAPIELNSKSDPWMEADDCELLRQLSQQVLPKIGVQVTRKLMCSAQKISRPSLEVKALVPMFTGARPAETK